MKKIIAALTFCLAVLTMLSSCNMDEVTTPEPTVSEMPAIPTATGTFETDIIPTPTAQETDALSQKQKELHDLIDNVEEDIYDITKVRKIKIEKPLDEDIDLERLFYKCCEKYKDLYVNVRENDGRGYSIHFTVYGKVLTQEELGGSELIISAYPDMDPVRSTIVFLPPNYAYPAEWIDKFTFEMFKSIYEMEEVTKIEIDFRIGFSA